MRRPDEEHAKSPADPKSIDLDWLLENLEPIFATVTNAPLGEVEQMLVQRDILFAGALEKARHALYPLVEGRRKRKEQVSNAATFTRGAALVAELTQHFPPVTQDEVAASQAVLNASALLASHEPDFSPKNLYRMAYDEYMAEKIGDTRLDAALKSKRVDPSGPMALGIGFGLALRFGQYRYFAPPETGSQEV